jgi:hypothetical protein
MKELLEKQYESVGFEESEGDPLLTKYHRINVLSTACSVGHTDCIGKAKEMYQDWMNRTEPNSDNP